MKAAVAGTGFMGWVHVEALRRAGIEIVGALGSTPEKSLTFCRKWSAGRAYESFDDILSDEEVDCVHIATPNRTHFEMTRQTLEAGKHVLCEKPLAMNSRETAELLSLSAERGEQAAGVNYNIRFYALCQEAAERIQQGLIGDILHVRGSYIQDWLLYNTDYNWRVLSEEGGPLRAVADIGTHWLDLIQHITNMKVNSVCADLQTVHETRMRPLGEIQTFSGNSNTPEQTEEVSITTEDAAAILLQFEDGVKGNLHVSQVTAGRKNCLQFEIAGSKGSLAWNSENPNVLHIGYRDRPNESLIRDPSLLNDRAIQTTSYPGGHNEGYADSFKHCFRRFYQYIEAANFSEQPAFATFADGHHEALVCDAILESHHQQQWVDVDES